MTRKIRERHDRAVTLVANRYGEIAGTSACDLRRSVLRLANRRGDADALPIDDDLVDYAFANMYLHHVEDPAAGVREMARVVKRGGVLILTDLNEHKHADMAEEHHDRWLGFAHSDVRQWFEAAGLVDAQVGPIGSECCRTLTARQVTSASGFGSLPAANRPAFDSNFAANCQRRRGNAADRGATSFARLSSTPEVS